MKKFIKVLMFAIMAMIVFSGVGPPQKDVFDGEIAFMQNNVQWTQNYTIGTVPDFGTVPDCDYEIICNTFEETMVDQGIYKNDVILEISYGDIYNQRSTIYNNYSFETFAFISSITTYQNKMVKIDNVNTTLGTHKPEQLPDNVKGLHNGYVTDKLLV